MTFIVEVSFEELFSMGIASLWVVCCALLFKNRGDRGVDFEVNGFIVKFRNVKSDRLEWEWR